MESEQSPALKSYLIRAVYSWVVDAGYTPYLLVKADGAGVHVPEQFVKDGQIVLNIRPEAVRNLVVGSALIEFVARFGGVSRPVSVPLSSVLAIYARENGQGLTFPGGEENPNEPPPSDETRGEGPKPSRPKLSVVK